MSESSAKQGRRAWRVRHKGRASQVLIYLGKQLRFFINESDWKVLPMAAVIAALVGMVVRRRFFITMEGSLIGGFALTCPAIWNGCFNSIQSICRERAIVKREHRSGMHISAYMAAHMIYQLLLCTAQTGLSMYVLQLMGVQFPAQGFMTRWMIVDVGISMLLISYAADMMSLFISSLSHTTTGAMTVMPFVLIFQLVFSGGLIPLPAWSQNLSNFTISNYGVRAIAAQSGYNELPMAAVWNTLDGMRGTEVGGTFTLGQVLDLLDSPAVEKRRDMEIMRSWTVGEAAEVLSGAEESLHLRDRVVAQPVTLRDALSFMKTSPLLAQLRSRVLRPAEGDQAALTVETLLDDLLGADGMEELLDREFGATVTLGQVLDFLQAEELAASMSDEVLNAPVTLGEAADFLRGNAVLQAHREDAFTFKTSIGDLLDLFGEDNVRTLIQTRTAAASQKAEYARTAPNIRGNWLMLALFAAAFALLATLALEFIDKDRR